MAKAYRHLTYKLRCQIFTLKQSDNYYSQAKIAEILNISQSTVSRELARNFGKNGYDLEEAHGIAIARRSKASAGNKKITHEAKAYIAYRLKEFQWSPEQISGKDMAKNCGVRLSHVIIYQYIRDDKQRGGALYKQLRRKGKKYQKRGKKTAGRGLIPNCVGIENRPRTVEDKIRFGDFEVDTIVGANHQGAILSIVDRKSKLTLLRILPRGTAENVKNAMVEALKQVEGLVRTITSDNGKEFAQHQEIAEQLDADFYFANPYCSWERGLNENTNGLVRQYLPKRTDFRSITQLIPDKIEYLLNNRPRKTLGYKTPLEVFFEETGKTLGPTIWVNCSPLVYKE
jgi:IS30 family transposase